MLANCDHHGLAYPMGCVYVCSSVMLVYCGEDLNRLSWFSGMKLPQRTACIRWINRSTHVKTGLPSPQQEVKIPTDAYKFSLLVP